LCQHIDILIRGFWWGSKKGKRKTSWISWDTVTMPKYMGGLVFREAELFNLVQLAKQAWRIIQEPKSLSARILKVVYFPGGDFIVATLRSRPSQVWRSILEG
jgi:hypothetical protein